MKRVFILLLLVLRNCDGDKIVKRFVNEQNNATDDSFQVNLSAGYGVHSENVSVTSPSPVYRFQERQIQKENETGRDQLPQPSQRIQDVLPTPSYQVHEKTPEVQEKHFHLNKIHRHRPGEKRQRQRNNELRQVNDLEHKESIRHETKLPGGTKIVEVLRVPAMYELHLQSDPQRLVSLNTAWLAKLMNQNQYKRPAAPVYQTSGTKNFYQQTQPSSGLNFPQQTAETTTNHQRLGGNVFQNLKIKYHNPKPNFVNQQKQVLQPVQNGGNYKPNYLRQNYQNLQASASSVNSLKKPQDASSQSSINYQQVSNEIPADYYQKPQALHEVPAPVLNKQSHKHSLAPITTSNAKTTSVPSLVYGKPAESYQSTTPPTLPSPSVSWSTNLQDQNIQNNLYGNYQFPQVDPILNYYQQPQDLISYKPENSYGHHLQYKKQNIFKSPNYQGYKNVQNHYNEAIGEQLDQNLVNVNGEVATYLNHDGTMTVSNFHHNPKLYRPPKEYEIPVTENPDDIPQDFGVSPYANQNNDFANFNNQLYSGYNDVITNQNQIENGDNQFRLQNTADLSHLLLGTARSSVEHEPANSYRRRYMAKRIQRPFSSIKPMDYILYIKERRVN